MEGTETDKGEIENALSFIKHLVKAANEAPNADSRPCDSRASAFDWIKQASKFPLSADAVIKIADMQRDLDAYSFVFANLIGYLGGKFGEHDNMLVVPAISQSMAATKEVEKQISHVLDAAFEARRKIIELKAKARELEEKLK